ncbi:hypothetical protein BBJ28_00012928 [Nothophytophthora sp. Chile5]|nr:hypothetical protein BBJ28_00012928 [Nothophytophthora sp. Chile5]
MARAVPSQPQSAQGGMQQQFFPVEAFEHGRQEVAALANASTPDEAFLDSLSAYPADGRSAMSGGAESGGFQRNSGAAITQLHVQTQSPLPIPPIPPSRVVVIPGMSLTASTRVVRMRDILNYDNPSATKAGAKRLQGRKHQRAPPKPKAPRKKSAVKRQKKQPEQQPQRRPSPTNEHSSAPSTQSVNAAVFRSQPPTKGFDPTRFAFVGSQATRELQQAASAMTPKPSLPPIPVVPRHSLQTAAPPPPSKKLPVAAIGSSQRTVVSASTQPKKRGPYTKKTKKTKKEDAPPDPSALPTGTQFTIKGPVKPDTNPTAVLSSVDRSMTTMTVSGSTPRPAPKAQGQGPIPRNVSTAMQIVGVLAIPNGLLPVNGATQGAGVGAAPRRKSKAKLPRPQLNPGAAIGAQAAMQQQPAGRAALLPPVSSTAADVATASTTAAPAVAKQAHVENKTVVIFCKRDFMRYQAAKIWRKYQEQLKKQEEWREVRVAGKRTRYLNSKYDDEIRKAHTRSHKKVGRPRKLAASLRLAQESEESGSDKIPATSSLVEASNARSTGIDNTGSSQSEEQAFTLPSAPAMQDGSNDSTSGALPGMADACSETTGVGVVSKVADQVGALAIAAESGNASSITAGIYALSGELNADATTGGARSEVVSRPSKQQLEGCISRMLPQH